MITITEENVKTWSELGSRGAFGKVINDIGANDPDVVVLTADLADATKVREFSKLYPERFFQVGIAEQNMIGIASGFALAGKTPFATTFACFASMRVCEQVRTDVCYPQLNVKIVGADGGLVMGTLGTTHYGLEDIGVLRSIPNLVIISPADGAEIVKATWAAARYKGPVYLRLTGGKDLPVIYNQDFDFEIGKAIQLCDGKDVTIIANGAMLYTALQAASLLENKGIHARVLDMHTVKPLDVEAVRKAAQDTRLIVTVEEHSIIGGLGSAVAETLSESGGAPKLIRFGCPDRFGHIATYKTMLERYGLTETNIASVVMNNL